MSSVIVLIVGLLGAQIMQLTIEQKAAIKEIEASGGSVYFKDEGGSRTVEQIHLSTSPKFQDANLQLLHPFRDVRDLAVTIVGLSISDDGFRALGELRDLGALGLTDVPITDDGIRKLRLGEKTKLSRLTLSGSRPLQLSDAIMPSIAKCKKLTQLSLNYTGITSKGLEHSSGLKRLRLVGLSGTRIDDEALAHLSTLPELSWLALGDTAITDEGVKHLQDLRLLDTLLLNNTQLTDKGLETLAGLKKLRSLRLDGTAVTDEGLRTLLKLEKLQDVTVDNTAVTIDGLKILHSHPALQRVSCQHLLTGEERERFLKELPVLKTFRAESEARQKKLEEARKKDFVSTRTVILHTITVGRFDAGGNLTPTDVVPYEVGNQYGYRISVHTPSGTIHIREVLELPAPVEWPDSEEVVVDGLRLLSYQKLNAGKTHVTEYELDCPTDKWAGFSQMYEILEGDPQGQYQFMIYLNGDLAHSVEFTVESD